MAERGGVPVVPGLLWSAPRPRDRGYDWVRTQGFERGIVVRVYVGGGGGLVAGWPLRRHLDALDGWWAGPILEPERGVLD